MKELRDLMAVLRNQLSRRVSKSRFHRWNRDLSTCRIKSRSEHYGERSACHIPRCSHRGNRDLCGSTENRKPSRFEKLTGLGSERALTLRRVHRESRTLQFCSLKGLRGVGFELGADPTERYKESETLKFGAPLPSKVSTT